MPVEKLQFRSAQGQLLAARLDRPDGKVRGHAILAHCFTCTKDIIAARRIAGDLARLGIAVLRFDFTGLGSSEGEFANTDFISNVDDLVAAADHLRTDGMAPVLLIGHSLGGAAVLAAAARIPEVKGVVTIGAPADTDHVLQHFSADLDTIERDGSAVVQLAGRSFRIGRSFVETARETNLSAIISALRVSLLVMHAPLDSVVGIANATKIFTAARHPKSFVSLDTADHLLSKDADARFAAHVIAAWATRLLPEDEPQGETPIEHVRVRETGEGRFQNTVQAGRHRLFADEPVSVGGDDTGPSPYDFLAAALAACTSMTLRIYAGFKKIEMGEITVDVSHAKVHAGDCADCAEDIRNGGGKIDRFERVISIRGGVPAGLAGKIEEIADKCPVHRTLEHRAAVITRVNAAPD